MNKTAIVENQTKDNTSGKPTKRIREEKPRKKDEKSVDHVLRALDSLGSTEEKLGAMCQKYAEMFNDHRMLQTAVKQAEKKNTHLQKEKEQLQAEHSKAILTRSRLENLCRELQRQNKAVKEECMLKMREEGEKKREVAAKFHSMLSEIGSLLAQNNDKNAKLRDDNLDMSMRLKSVCDQFEKKEQHVENLAKQMQLEMQLADAKLAKAKMEMDIEKETLQKEKQQLLIELADYKRKLVEMKASELALREQITMYSEKYEEFHKALLQSNSAIGEFKAEMERMTKHIRRLEKETATWKSRYDAAQRTLSEVTQGKIRSDEALGLAQRRLTALQGICRGLQDQCRQLRGETRRDSQVDEDYKKLEAQIKEVERENELDTSPCPRRVSADITESVTDDSIVTGSSDISETVTDDTIVPVSSDIPETVNIVPVSSDISETVTDSAIVPVSSDITETVTDSTIVPVSSDITESVIDDPIAQVTSETEASNCNSISENNELLSYEPKKINDVPMPDTKDVIDEHKPQVIEASINNSNVVELADPVEKGGNVSCSITEDKPNVREKDVDINNETNSVVNIEESPQENRLLQNETLQINIEGNIDISCEQTKNQSVENEIKKENLEKVENVIIPTEVENSQSTEESINGLVNHMQEVSLLESNPPNSDSTPKSDANINEEERGGVSISENVPNTSNSVNETSLQPGISLNSNTEKKFKPPNKYCVMFGPVPGLSDEVTRNLLSKIDLSKMAKVNSNSDDPNLAKNKKKRKSKK